MSLTPQSSILLYGPSGTGKTTTGRLLAEALGMAFNDLDENIESRSGRKIPEIFASDGEAAFRELERASLERLLTCDRVISDKGKIVALGGGALTHIPTRALAEAHACRVLLLRADPDVIIPRLQADTSNPRPLLQGNPHAKLKAMLERRSPHYAEFPLQLDTTHLTPAEAAWQAQILLGMFRISGMGQPYDVRVGGGLLDSLGGEMKTRGLRGPIAIVTDANLRKWYASRAAASLESAGYAANIITIPSGEQFKTTETVQNLWTGFLRAGIERGSTVVALGGGVVGDLTGFAAAMWLRGVKWVNAPTTLLAMCDLSLGGKTGADLPEGKNLVGAFHSPALVLADPDVLGTLPEVELHNGMAEVVKHGVIADPELFEMCQDIHSLRRTKFADFAGLVSRSMAVKIKVIQEDPFEQGRRQALNLGHTVGHAVELASGFRLKHGQAVAIGMAVEARLAEQMGLADPKQNLATRIINVLQAIGLPTEIPPDLDRDAIRQAMLLDKKRAGGKVKFALPVKIGEVATGIEVDEDLIANL